MVRRQRVVRPAKQASETAMNLAPGLQRSNEPGLASRRILFATTAHHLPELTGGVESTTHELCLALAERGCAVAVLARTRRMSRFAWHARANRLIGRGPVALDSGLGYPVHRARKPLEAIDAVVGAFRPTLAVIQSGRLIPLARAFASRGVPALVYLHNQTFSEMGGEFFADPLVRYVTNSDFMADALTPKLGTRPDVLLPLIKADRYRTESARQVVTFINPTPIKGLEIALHLARHRPDVPFEFIESWPLKRDEWSTLNASVAGMPNVQLLRRTDDMRPIYGRSRLLLAPSQWEEPWGRVVSEAQISGIPVLASRTGGLPEAVGPGGMLVSPHDRAEAWEQPFAAIWDDKETYDDLADAARAHADRPAIQSDTIVSSLIAMADSQLGRAQ
jgi:glycosyltransferase involved in cell wall biosynthesis